MTPAMMENISPEVWTPVSTAEPEIRNWASRRYEPETELPRSSEVLREIGFILVVHAIVVVFILSVLKALVVH